MALKEPTCAKYLAEYAAGREGGVDLLKSFVGPKGKGASIVLFENDGCSFKLYTSFMK